MSRHIEITLEKRNVSCTALMLDERAPLTCNAVWEALPQSAQAWHAKYASNEVYTLIPPLTEHEVGRENSTIAPAAGDVVFLEFPVGQVPPAMRGELGLKGVGSFVDLALFYAPNNLLLDPSAGYVPGNVFARVVENLDQMNEACMDVWRNGFNGERLSYRRVS